MVERFVSRETYLKQETFDATLQKEGLDVPEYFVLMSKALGISELEAAEYFHTSFNMFDAVRSRLITRMNVKDSLHAVIKAAKIGLIYPEEFLEEAEFEAVRELPPYLRAVLNAIYERPEADLDEIADFLSVTYETPPIYLYRIYRRFGQKRGEGNIVRPVLAYKTEFRLNSYQHQLLRWVAEGKNNKEIARELDLTEDILASHLVALYRKTGVRTRLEAILTAISRNDLDLREFVTEGGEVKRAELLTPMGEYILKALIDNPSFTIKTLADFLSMDYRALRNHLHKIYDTLGLRKNEKYSYLRAVLTYQAYLNRSEILKPEVELTPEQIRLLALVGYGFGNSDIAKILSKPKSNVKNDLAKLYNLLHAKNRFHAVMIGIKLGLILLGDAVSKEEEKKVRRLSAKDKEAIKALIAHPDKELAKVARELEYTPDYFNKKVLARIYKKLEIKGKGQQISRIRASMIYLKSRRKRVLIEI